MIITNSDPPVRVDVVESPSPMLIETIRNLQLNILNELYRKPINKEYIDECNLEIEKIISKIINFSS